MSDFDTLHIFGRSGVMKKDIMQNNDREKEVKDALLKFQEKTDYGLVLGKKCDSQPNGTYRYPKFNLRSIYDVE